MALDLAKEVGSLLEQMQALVGRTLAESKDKRLSGPALRLNALHHELKDFHDSLKAGEHGAAAAGAAGVSAHTDPAACTTQPGTPHEEAWGSAFHSLPPPTKPDQTPRPDRERKKDSEEIKDIWDDLSDS